MVCLRASSLRNPKYLIQQTRKEEPLMEVLNDDGVFDKENAFDPHTYLRDGWAERLSDFPRELKEKRIWCVWRRVSRGGQDTKVPYQTNGLPAKSNDSST